MQIHETRMHLVYIGSEHLHAVVITEMTVIDAMDGHVWSKKCLPVHGGGIQSNKFRCSNSYTNTLKLFLQFN